MTTFSAVAVGLMGVLIATAALAQVRNPPAPRQAGQGPQTSQTLTAPAIPANPDQGVGQAHPVLTIGKEPVVVWAPVQPPYDSHVNRNLAESPIWEGQGF